MFGTGEDFPYLECSRCGTFQLLEPPADLAPYYPPSYSSLTPVRSVPDGTLRHLYKELRTNLALRSELLARPLYPPGSGPIWLTWLKGLGLRRDSAICDVGTGTGALLAYLSLEGFTNLTGIDPFIGSDIRTPGYTVQCTSLERASGEYDLLMLHHSLEHMPSPRAALDRLQHLTAPGGHLLIRIPVAQKWAWRRYGANWYGLDPPRHLFTFSACGLVELVQQFGFRFKRCFYDSSDMQFWASEQNERGIPLRSPRSYRTSPADSIFTADEIAHFRRQSTVLNAVGEGDTAAFIFQRAKGE
jgi:SAM-dependent methyltransferase